MTSTEQQGEKSSATHCATWVLPSLLAFSILLLCLPTPGGMTSAAHRLLSIAVLMASLWVTQAIPLAATSLLPLALFPLFGIQTADETSTAFVEDSG